MTKEHLWSDWMGAMLGAPKGHQQVAFKGGLREEYVPQPAIDIPHDPITKSQVRKVCGTCNSGWMSSLEAAVKPVLTSMINGQRTVLGGQEVTALTQWLTLKFMIFDHAAGPGSFTQGERTAFWKFRTVPPTLTITLFWCGVGKWRHAYGEHDATISNSAIEPRLKNVKSQAVGFGELFVMGMYRDGVNFPLAVPDDSYIELWPLVTAWTWPPRVRLTEEEAQGLERSLVRMAYWPVASHARDIG